MRTTNTINDVSDKDNQINRDEIKVWNEEVKELLNERRSSQLLPWEPETFLAPTFP